MRCENTFIDIEMLQFIGKLLLWGIIAAVVAVILLLFVTLLPLENGYSMRVVESGSMEPTIPLGAAILTTQVDTYNEGDVVTFQRREDEEATTHRIISIETNEEGVVEYLMQGDANNAPDMRAVEYEEIAGKVVFQIKYLGFVLDFARQPIGFLLLVGLPAGWIIYEQIIKIRREIKSKESNN